jgi:hypothetical protein
MSRAKKKRVNASRRKRERREARALNNLLNNPRSVNIIARYAYELAKR